MFGAFAHEDLAADHAKKLRDHLYVLDSLTSICRRMVLFKAAEGADVVAKGQELGDACAKTDLFIKLGKSMVTNLKHASP